MFEYLIEIVLVNGNLKIHQAFIQRRLYFACSQFFVGIDSGIGKMEIDLATHENIAFFLYFMNRMLLQYNIKKRKKIDLNALCIFLKFSISISMGKEGNNNEAIYFFSYSEPH